LLRSKLCWKVSSPARSSLAKRPTPGYVTYNRRIMYAALNWGVENYSAIIDCVRELCGGGVFQMPADGSVLHDPWMAERFSTYWRTPQLDALSRMKLFRLAWDIIGSEFAGRHQQYEKFFPGASFIVRNHNYREAPWGKFHGLVDQITERMVLPAKVASARAAAE